MVDRSIDPASLQTIQGILDDYTSWFLQVIRHLFYPHAEGMKDPIEMPVSFLAWRDRAQAGQEKIDVGELDRIVRLQDELFTQSNRLIDEAMQVERQPRFDELNDLCSLYESFRIRLRRVGDDQIMAGLGFDAETGLRHGMCLGADMTSEMERMIRSNVGFSVALLRLRDYLGIQASCGDAFPKFLKWFGETIQSTARVFDDTYRLRADEFLIMLKSTDLYGAQRYSDRLREIVKQTPLLVNGQVVPVSLSFCIAEPVAGEDFEKFIELMRNDLEKNLQEEGDAVVQYEDISPLQRYVRQTQS